jgi:hypothetical protein
MGGGRCQQRAHPEELTARHDWETDPRSPMAFSPGETLELAAEVLQLLC